MAVTSAFKDIAATLGIEDYEEDPVIRAKPSREHGTDQVRGSDWNPVRLKEALSRIPADDQPIWFGVGAGLHDASGGSEDGFELWDGWAQTTTRGNYDPKRQRYLWDRFSSRNGRNDITAATIYHLARQSVRLPFGRNRQGSSVPNTIFPTAKPRLSQRTIKNVRDCFAEWGHGPSDDHWRGLIEIANAYEDMAEGKAERAFYISSLPPGMGKTTVAVEGTKALLADSSWGEVAVIYFLSRLEEIRTLVERMGLERKDFAVLTSDDELNRLGNPIPEQARVLFTTQQRLEGFSKSGAAFADMKDLRYRGKPRQVRVWDEAILPSMTLTADKDGLFGLLKGIRGYQPDMADMIEEFAISLTNHAGEFVTVPDIEREGIDLNDFRSLFDSDSSRDTAEALWYLSGRTVRVRRDPRNGMTTLDYEDILPDDLAPMMILDASGDLRQTYRFWADERRNLRRLHSPKKSYAGLTIRHFDKGAGKNVNWNPKEVVKLAESVVQMIAEIPENESVLVVHHKSKRKDADIVKMIRQKLPSRSGPVEFINWGRHTATNEFKDTRNVILAGVLNYNLAQYEAAGRGAKKAKTEDPFTDDEMRQTRIGEISHHVFQAAGRGAIRKTVDGGCPEGCNLYAIFSTHKVTGFPKEQLLTIFPDAKLQDWSIDGEEKARLTGRVGDVLGLVLEAVRSGKAISQAEVRKRLGIEKSNFRRTVLKNEKFLSACGQSGVVLKEGVFAAEEASAGR